MFLLRHKWHDGSEISENPSQSDMKTHSELIKWHDALKRFIHICIRLQCKSKCDSKKAHNDPGSFDLIQAQSHGHVFSSVMTGSSCHSKRTFDVENDQNHVGWPFWCVKHWIAFRPASSQFSRYHLNSTAIISILRLSSLFDRYHPHSIGRKWVMTGKRGWNGRRDDYSWEELNHIESRFLKVSRSLYSGIHNS
jgi:hypothetical protein